ncbi:hypothetical protein PAECIP111802_06453 [Paenibacillus allorhizosphaerae]|uniref:Uncharacterized protein n=1 Tax=Paenibacillus allorhizosphaerae TaxID=2849866 RepID=A0ABM8VSI2_9BACL|nr:hypothetical protein PAECIP111802_06453 [Paenibacillus allorhizosphaerae]
MFRNGVCIILEFYSEGCAAGNCLPLNDHKYDYELNGLHIQKQITFDEEGNMI